MVFHELWKQIINFSLKRFAVYIKSAIVNSLIHFHNSNEVSKVNFSHIRR